MEQVTSLFAPREPMFAPLEAAAEQERARSALHGLRDLLEAASPIISFDPHSLGALVGLVADAMPVWPESDD